MHSNGQLCPPKILVLSSFSPPGHLRSMSPKRGIVSAFALRSDMLQDFSLNVHFSWLVQLPNMHTDSLWKDKGTKCFAHFVTVAMVLSLNISEILSLEKEVSATEVVIFSRSRLRQG